MFKKELTFSNIVIESGSELELETCQNVEDHIVAQLQDIPLDSNDLHDSQYHLENLNKTCFVFVELESDSCILGGDSVEDISEQIECLYYEEKQSDIFTILPFKDNKRIKIRFSINHEV